METKEQEQIRMVLQKAINSVEAGREALEKYFDQVWDTKELQNDFEVQSFFAPFCIVKRKSDGKMGSLLFQHMPRYYFDFQED